MIRDGVDPKSLFDSPLNTKLQNLSKSAAPAAAAAGGGGGSNVGANGYKCPPKDSPDLNPFKKMLKMRLPQGAVVSYF